MDQDGVEVRPIEMLSGDSDFNETFFTDARTHKDNVVGEVNGGWAVAMTLLGYERGEAAATMPIMFQAEAEKLLAFAKETGASTDPVLRDRLARIHIEVEIMGYLGKRSLTNFLTGGRAGTDRVDVQDLLERVPPADHRTGRRRARRGGDGARRASRPGARSGATSPGRATTRRRGSARSTTPGPARSTPVRRRSSATSSARWSSACPRSPGRPRGGVRSAIRVDSSTGRCRRRACQRSPVRITEPALGGQVRRRSLAGDEGVVPSETLPREALVSSAVGENRYQHRRGRPDIEPARSSGPSPPRRSCDRRGNRLSEPASSRVDRQPLAPPRRGRAIASPRHAASCGAPSGRSSSPISTATAGASTKC